MNRDIQVNLKEARKLYDSKKYVESLNLYKQLFKDNQEDFTRNNLISYCWAIYHVRVKNFKDENELFDATEFITDLIPQANLNHKKTCPYTFSIMKVLKFLQDQNEYYNMSYWFDKLNPKLLDEKREYKNGRLQKSRKEAYYDYASKSHLESADWQLCIDVSKEALSSLNEFTNNSDTWYRWRIAKSLRQLNQQEEALKYLNEVVKVKKEWYIFRQFAENYHDLGEDEKALNYLCEAILTDDSIAKKVNLFYLAYEILDNLNMDIAFKHVELFYLLKLESKAQIPDEVKDLDINKDQLDKNLLVDEINGYWLDFKFKNKELKYGTITKFVEGRNFGFILGNDDESVFFHKSEFKGDKLYVGQAVSFYTEKSFDKSKNEESLKAVCIRGE